jgi:hypothetical protein
MNWRMAVVIAAFVGLPGVAGAACNGQVVTKTGPTGVTLQLCMDGKHTTCLRDSERLGWSADSAKRFCDGRRAQGRIK